MGVIPIPPAPAKETGKRDGPCYTPGFVRASGGEVITEDPARKHAEVVDSRGSHKILKGGGQCWIENNSGVRVAGPWKETGLFIAHGYLNRLEGEAGPATGKQQGSPFPSKSKDKPPSEDAPDRHKEAPPTQEETEEVEEPITELCNPAAKHRDKGDSEKDGEGEHEDLAKKRLEEMLQE